MIKFASEKRDILIILKIDSYELVHIETQELTSTGFKTAIFKNE